MESGELERLWKLQTSANELVLGGKREAEPLIAFLQGFVFGLSGLPDIDWPKTFSFLGMEAEYAEAVKKLGVGGNPNQWIVPMVKGITCNKVVAGFRAQKVQVYTYVNDLDKDVTVNDRDPNRDGSYLIGFRRTIEADEENKNLSANMLVQQNHKGIVLCERLLLGFGYYVTTGQHLDVKCVTLCAGSRDSDGHVPLVYFSLDYRKVYVYWYNPDYRRGNIRSRSAVPPVILPA